MNPAPGGFGSPQRAGAWLLRLMPLKSGTTQPAGGVVVETVIVVPGFVVNVPHALVTDSVTI